MARGERGEEQEGRINEGCVGRIEEEGRKSSATRRRASHIPVLMHGANRFQLASCAPVSTSKRARRQAAEEGATAGDEEGEEEEG